MTELDTNFSEEKGVVSEHRLIGYARVSTDDQKLDLQLDALLKAGVLRRRIYTDHASGVGAKRHGFEMMKKQLREGDCLVVWKLDRLGRSLSEMIAFVAWLGDRGVELRVLTQNLDTTTAFGKFMFHIFGALAEMERDLISERTKAGIEAARRRGRHPGRPAAISADQWAEASRRMQAGEGAHTVSKDMGLKRSTVYQYREDLAAGRPYPFDKKGEE